MTERTIVIGLDGLIKPWADRLIAGGAMPNLARLVAAGTCAVVSRTASSLRARSSSGCVPA